MDVEYKDKRYIPDKVGQKHRIVKEISENCRFHKEIRKCLYEKYGDMIGEIPEKFYIEFKDEEQFLSECKKAEEYPWLKDVNNVSEYILGTAAIHMYSRNKFPNILVGVWQTSEKINEKRQKDYFQYFLVGGIIILSGIIYFKKYM